LGTLQKTRKCLPLKNRKKTEKKGAVDDTRSASTARGGGRTSLFTRSRARNKGKRKVNPQTVKKEKKENNRYEGTSKTPNTLAIEENKQMRARTGDGGEVFLGKKKRKGSHWVNGDPIRSPRCGFLFPAKEIPARGDRNKEEDKKRGKNLHNRGGDSNAVKRDLELGCFKHEQG